MSIAKRYYFALLFFLTVPAQAQGLEEILDRMMARNAWQDRALLEFQADRKFYAANVRLRQIRPCTSKRCSVSPISFSRRLRVMKAQNSSAPACSIRFSKPRAKRAPRRTRNKSISFQPTTISLLKDSKTVRAGDAFG